MVIFRCGAFSAVCNAFIGLQAAPSTTPVETTVPALPRLDAWTASVVEVLREKESRAGRRQKNYSDSIGKFLRSGTAQIVKPSGNSPSTAALKSSKLVPEAASSSAANNLSSTCTAVPNALCSFFFLYNLSSYGR